MTPVRRLARWPSSLLRRALGPSMLRWRAWMNAPLQTQLHQMKDALHATVDAGVVALAARASVLDASAAEMHRHQTNLTNGLAARLDALNVNIAALANAQTRLDSQQRLIFDGLLEELIPLRAEISAGIAPLSAALGRVELGLSTGIAPLHTALDRVHADFSAALAPLQAALDRVESGRTADFAPLYAALGRIEQYSIAGARRIAVSCGSDVLVRTEAGYIVCAGSDLSVLSTLIESGDLEQGTRRLIESLLRPGDCFVDVGANIGMHTLAAGRALQRQGAIHAFEPFEATRVQLQKSVWLNGLADITTIHADAVSDRAGSASLYLGASSGHHSLFALNTEGGAYVQVRTVRLDDVVTQPVNLVKIDAEGAELAVLTGARKLIDNNPAIALIVECGPVHLVRNGHTVDAWLAEFAALGLVWRSIDPVSGALAEMTSEQLAAAESTNLLFARPDAPCWTQSLEQT